MNIIHIILESNLLNFVIVLGIIIFLIYKINLKQKLEKIRNNITDFVEESSNEKNISENELNEIKNKIKKLPQETDEIQKSAKNNVENISQKLENELEEKMSDIDNNTNRILNLETKKFKSKLTLILSETSINLAEENAINQLENNRDLHDKYIYEAINELDRIDL